MDKSIGRVLRNGFLTLLTAAVAGAGLVTGIGSASAQGQVSLTAVPSRAVVQKGDSFTVEVVVDSGATELRGAQVALAFDPAAVRVDSVEVGSHFADWAAANGGNVELDPQGAIDNAAGTVALTGAAIMGGAATSGPTGRGPVLTYHMTALDFGASPIDISAGLVADSLSRVMTANESDGQVQVAATLGAVPSQSVVNAGQTFAVDVVVQAGTSELRGAQAALHFDPLLVRVNGVTEGSFFSDWAAANGGSTDWAPGAINNTTGVVSVSTLGILGGSATSGPTGTGVVMTFSLTALANGLSALDLTECLVADSLSRTLQPVTYDGQVGAVSLVARPSKTLVNVGETFTVNVEVNTGNLEIRGVEAALAFDAAKVRVDSVVEGDFLSNWAGANGGGTEFDAGAVGSGTVATSTVGIVGGAATSGPTGSGVALVYNVTALASGTTTFDLTSGLVADNLSHTVSPVLAGASISITNVTLTAVPSATTVSVGQAFDVEVRVSSGATELRGVQVALNFDPALASVESVSEGSFLKDWAVANGGDTDFVPGTIGSGTVSTSTVNVIGGAATSGPAGTGAVLVYHMKALATGDMTVDLVDGMVATSLAQAIDAGETDAAVHFQAQASFPVGDANQDGAVDFFDLATVGLHWGEAGGPSAPWDVNGDNAVDFFDLATVGLHWGEHA